MLFLARDSVALATEGKTWRIMKEVVDTKKEISFFFLSDCGFPAGKKIEFPFPHRVF